MKKTSLIVLLFIALLSAVNAEIITVQVTATVSVFDDFGPDGGYFGGGIAVGNTLIMTYSYDTETPDGDPQANNGVYYQSIPNILSVNVGNYTFQSDASNLNYYIYLNQDITGDTYLVRSTNNIIPTEDYSGNFDIYWQLIYNKDTFNNTNLPTIVPDISVSNAIQIGDLRNFQIQAIPTFVEIIPEPITLLTMGFGGIFAFRYRKNNK